MLQHPCFRFEVKKPPPRPTAPKPKSMAAKPVPGASMFSSEELAAMAAEDLDDFNDPAFLNYLKMSGGLPGGLCFADVLLLFSKSKKKQIR